MAQIFRQFSLKIIAWADTFFRNSKSYGNFVLFNTSVIAINLLSTPAWPCSLVTVTGRPHRGMFACLLKIRHSEPTSHTKRTRTSIDLQLSAFKTRSLHVVVSTKSHTSHITRSFYYEQRNNRIAGCPYGILLNLPNGDGKEFVLFPGAIGGDTCQPAFFLLFNYKISVGFRNFILTRTYDDNVIPDISFL